MNQNPEQIKGIKEGFIGQRLFVLPDNIKRTLSQNPLTKGFYLTAIGHYPRANSHEITRKRGSNQYILIYCTEGEGYITINGTQHIILPNTFLIIPKNISHNYKSDIKNPWSIYWVHFTGDNARQIYERTLQNGAAEVCPVPFDENRIRVFDQMYSILEHSFNDMEMEIMALNLLHFVSSLVYYKEANPSIFNTDLVSSSISFMKSNLQKKFEIEDLAAMQQISVSHYCRIFKQKTGSSPINYLNHLKIQKSCQYLYFTDKSIKAICIEVGFNDPFYFSRLFRKIIGMAPSEYKQLHKKTTDR